MPRSKASTTIEKPVSLGARGRKSKSIATGSAVVTQRKPRRSPYEVVQDLKLRRAELARIYDDRLSKLDSRIQRLEARYEKKIKVTQLLKTMTTEQLARELENVRKQQKILKSALKAHQ